MRISLLLYFIFGCAQLFAQDVERQQLIDSSAVGYLRMADRQSALYYGKEQEGHLRALNHPYLKDDQYAKARLSYRRIIYPETMLRFDVNRDELVILSPDQRSIVLFPENVDFAELHGYTIIYFLRDNLPGCPSTGYYLLLHSGKYKVLEKQTAALMQKDTFSSAFEQHYVLSVNYFLNMDGVYYTIRNKKGLLKLLHPYKKELKRFISSHGWQFRHDAEKLIPLTVGEYEKLSGWQ